MTRWTFEEVREIMKKAEDATARANDAEKALAEARERIAKLEKLLWAGDKAGDK